MMRVLPSPGRLARCLAPLALAAALLAGCASPQPHYFSLAPDARDTRDTRPTPAAAVSPAQQPVWIEVAPVRVPEALNRQQLVVREGGRLKVLDLSRWTSPLPDELRDGLSQSLQLSMGAVDVYQQGLSNVEPVYRITTEVVRMDAEVGQRASATLQWTVRRLPDGKVTAGRTQADLPAPGDVDGVVSAYRQALAGTAADIAGAVQSLAR
jgi:uncharacterized lipoprotein YmbA